jgi:hypothetical protein
VYQTLNDGRRYSPEAFDRLIDERPETVFLTLQRSTLAEAANKAFWEEKEACQPTWADLRAENAEAERLRQGGAAAAEGTPSAPADVPAREGTPSTDAEVDTKGEGADDADEDAWVEDVTLDSDRATLARYHEWLTEKSEPFFEEMMTRKARLDER